MKDASGGSLITLTISLKTYRSKIDFRAWQGFESFQVAIMPQSYSYNVECCDPKCLDTYKSA